MIQEFTSKETSINTVNAIYKKGYFKIGDEILDYGGGKYDSNVKYLSQIGIKCFVFDPYNRSIEHNDRVLNYFKAKQGADNIVCSNVLCVIKENEVVLDILRKIYNISSKRAGSKIYIQIYEGTKSGVGTSTKKGYQRNEIAANYLKYIEKVFNGASVIISRKGNIFEIIFI